MKPTGEANRALCQIVQMSTISNKTFTKVTIDTGKIESFVERKKQRKIVPNRESIISRKKSSSNFPLKFHFTEGKSVKSLTGGILGKREEGGIVEGRI